MDKKVIAYLIWLYDTELDYEHQGKEFEAATVAELREKFADMFGVNDFMQDQMRD